MTANSDQVVQFDWTGAGWSDAAAGGPKIESQEFRDEQYEFINSFIEFVRRLPDLSDWYRKPVDLLEAARLDLMFQSRTPVRDWISWQRLFTLNPRRVEVLAPQSTKAVVDRDCGQMTLPFDLRLTEVRIGSSTLSGKEPGLFRLAAHRLIERLESRWAPRAQSPRGKPDRTRVLFLDHYPNSTHILIPLWRRLSGSEHHQCLYIAGREKVKRELERNGVHSINLRRCVPFVSTRNLTPPDWNILVHKFFTHLESTTSRPTPPSVLDAFNELADSLTEIKLTAIRLHSAFERFRPNLFFVSSGAHPAARIGELLSPRYQCASIHLQHGLYKGEKETQNLLSETTCLWGNFHRHLMEQNPCQGSLLVTGSPKHDELRRKYSSVEQSERPLVAFYSTRKASSLVAAADFERHLLAVYAAARTLQNVDFVVKLHPSEQRDVIEALDVDRSRPANLRITHTDDAYELLQRCHVAMTVSSTVGYEALLFERPLLVLNLTGGPCELTLPESASIRRVTQAENLVATIQQLLNTDGKVADFGGEYWLNDGRSLDRILEMAEQLVIERSHDRQASL